MTESAVLDHQLIFVRSVFVRAVSAARDQTEVGRMQALMFADVAVETLIKYLVNAKDPKNKSENVRELVAALRGFYPKLAAAPDLDAVLRFRNARNHVQHEGHVPTAAEVQRHLEDIERSMNVIVLGVYGVSFDEVSSVSLVRTPGLREALEAAQANLAAGNPEVAIVCVAAVFMIMEIRADTWVRYANGHDLKTDEFRALRVDPILLWVFGMQAPDWYPRLPLRETEPQFARLALKFSITELCELQVAKRLANEFGESWKAASAAKPAAEAAAPGSGSDGPDPAPSSLARLPYRLPEGRVVEAGDVARMVELLAERLWNLEASDPEVIGSRHPASPDFKQPSELQS